MSEEVPMTYECLRPLCFLSVPFGNNGWGANWVEGSAEEVYAQRSGLHGSVNGPVFVASSGRVVARYLCACAGYQTH